MDSRLHFRVAMKLVLIPLLAAAALFGQSVPQEQEQEQATADLNVNSRYTVESVDVTNTHHYRLSTSILDEMHRLIGSRLNDDAVKRLAGKIRGELRAHDVTFKLLRGGNPESVKVLFEVEKGQSDFDVSIPKFAYNSREGGSGVGEVPVDSAQTPSHSPAFPMESRWPNGIRESRRSISGYRLVAIG